MKDYVILFNAKSNNGRGEETAKKLADIVNSSELEYVDICGIKNFKEFFGGYEQNQKFFLCGGDGTLNHFVNDCSEEDMPDSLYYYPAGTGNDFWNDLDDEDKTQPILVKKYLIHLPTVTINDKVYKFINNVGYGIDGYCCEEGDRQRKTSTKEINYAGIAIKGLLGKFKPASGVVTVDGMTRHYKKIWLAPMMHGRRLGGGMIATPNQDRLDPEYKLSVMVWHDSGKLPTLMNFPNIFKGEHIKKTKMCEIMTGKEITVEFDRPIAAQVDGETVLGVTKCVAKSYNK